MSDELIISQCSPTLAGIKTGSLFSCRIESKEDVIRQIRYLNKLLGRKGIRIIPLRFRKNSALIYVYRPSKLKKDISDGEVMQILKKYGYTSEAPEKCICHLINRIRDLDDFPHEIGLFLGYPLEDVCGFIEHNAKDEKLVGYWKVYGDEHEAQKLFDMYRKCTEDYLKRIRAGNSIEKLTVAV